MKRFWLKLSFWAVISVAAAMFAVSAAFADVMSEHNEQHAAEMAAQNALFDAGCTRTNIKRTARWAVHSDPGSQKYVVTGNGLTVECVKWESSTAPIWKISWTAPTTRADGSPLPPDQIAGYQVIVDGQPVAMAAGTSYRVAAVPVGTAVELRTVDTGGLLSDSVRLVLR